MFTIGIRKSRLDRRSLGSAATMPIAVAVVVALLAAQSGLPGGTSALSAGSAIAAVRSRIPAGLSNNSIALKIIDWATYMKKYDKRYSSLAQTLVRQKLFMARVYEVFITALKHYFKLIGYYTAINKYSDATQDEARLLMSGDSQAAADYSDDDFVDDETALMILDANDEGATDGEESEAPEEAPTATSAARRKRDTAGAPANTPDIPESKLGEVAQEAEQERGKLTAMARILTPGMPPPLSIPSFVSQSFSWLAGAESEQPEQVIVHQDWRKSGCIGVPRDQGYCGSCYAFSSMGHAEWAYCRSRHGVFARLSPQYVIDCAPLVNSAEFDGCNRGPVRLVPTFIKEFGLELEKRRPYIEQTKQCPVTAKSAPEERGSIRPEVRESIRMRNNTMALDRAIQGRPVILSMHLPKNFFAYGGGYIEDCDVDQAGGHAVLIVGSMTEDNTDYLLVQNSYGAYWGIDGYFKLKRSPEIFRKCVKHFMIPLLSFSKKAA